jgi:hypothetical protein
MSGRVTPNPVVLEDRSEGTCRRGHGLEDSAASTGMAAGERSEGRARRPRTSGAGRTAIGSETAGAKGQGARDMFVGAARRPGGGAPV